MEIPFSVEGKCVPIRRSLILPNERKRISILDQAPLVLLMDSGWRFPSASKRNVFPFEEAFDYLCSLYSRSIVQRVHDTKG